MLGGGVERRGDHGHAQSCRCTPHTIRWCTAVLLVDPLHDASKVMDSKSTAAKIILDVPCCRPPRSDWVPSLRQAKAPTSQVRFYRLPNKNYWQKES